jgi:hypothetical protein
MGVSSALRDRIRGEFLEMPGLKLTPAQARVLWNLNEATCAEALQSLADDGFLHQTPSGAFIALPSATKMLKASLPDTTRMVRCPHCQHLNSVATERAVRARCAACTRIIDIAAASS